MYISIHKSTHYYCQIFLMNRGLSRQIFEESSNIEFHENPRSGRGVVPCGKTERHTWRSYKLLFANLGKARQTWFLCREFISLDSVSSEAEQYDWSSDTCDLYSVHAVLPSDFDYPELFRDFTPSFSLNDTTGFYCNSNSHRSYGSCP